MIKVKVIADASLIREYIQTEENNSLNLDDKNTAERANVLTNPWYPNNNNIERKISPVPYNMIILDGREVGIELIDWNEPKKFHNVVFIRDENMCKIMRDFYHNIWNTASAFPPSFKQQEQQQR
jgi:hypothetical protein